MRLSRFALPLILVASPTLAEHPAPIALQLPPELSDLTMADRLGRMANTLTRALMDLPIGELEAAAQGREPTPVDRTKRVRDMLARPGLEHELEAKVTASGRAMQAMARILAQSLPSIMATLDETQRSLERVTANIPDPTYPRR